MNLMNNYNLSEKFRNLPLRTKKIIAIVSVSAFIVITVAVAFLLNFQKQEAIKNSHYEEEVGALMTHWYLVDYNFTRGASNAIRNNFDSVILSDAEKQSAPRENKPSEDLYQNIYEAVIDEESFITERNLAKPTYSFNLNISDGRVYKVYLHSDTGGGTEYVVTILYRTDIDDQKTFAYINTNNTQYEQVMRDWILRLGLRNPSILTDKLEVLEK